MEEKKTMLSGIQPSGELHLGNYLGPLRHWPEMIEEYECYFFMADLHTITVRQDPAALRRRVLTLLKALPLEITGPRPVEEAIVTSGGVAVKEVNPSTMESKLLPGLFFAGEVLDVDAYTGGFNLQIAWCTGRLAGVSAGEAARRKKG